MISLHALGNAEIQTEVARISPAQEILFAAALYLVLQRGKHTTRSALAQLLWPDAEKEVCRHRLRQTLLQLRKLGFEILADRETVQISEANAQTDFDWLSGDNPTPPEPIGDWNVLAHYTPDFSAEYSHWLDTKKAHIGSRVTKFLVTRIETARMRGDWRRVEDLAADCLTLDPLNESAVLALAEAAAMKGAKQKATAILDRYLAETGRVSDALKTPALFLRKRVAERTQDRRELATCEPMFVGRQAEIEALVSQFNDSRNSHSIAALLIGEAGIGKSRLTAEFTKLVALRGAQVRTFACKAADIDRPLSLFVDLVPQLRELPGALGCSPESFAWLKRLTEFDHATYRSDEFDSEFMARNIRRALLDLLDSLADERCLVITIEDAHWLDSSSARMLASIIEWSSERRILFVVNARAQQSPFLSYVEQIPLRRIQLDPLDMGSATELVQSLWPLPNTPLAPELIKWCLAVGEGNPFFLQELAHHGMETGNHEAPPSVANVLQDRISRLSKEALHVLQACAVLGEHATLEHVEQMLQYQAYQILSAVEELSKAAMIVSGTEFAVSTFLKPRHDFLTCAALANLAPISLAFLHSRAADILEAKIPNEATPTSLLWSCAHHRQIAGDLARALSLSIQCAEHLLDLGMAHEASATLQAARDYCTGDQDRLDLLPRLALALELDGEWEKSKEVLRTCVQLCARITPANGTHNDYELLLLDARHRSALDFATLLEDATRCALAVDAQASHRVDAGIMAMKLANDFGQVDRFESVYSEILPLLNDTSVKERCKLEIGLIYRTMRSRNPVPVEDIWEFAKVARLEEGDSGYSRALILCSTACRLSARYRAGLDFIAEAFRHANSCHLRARTRAIKLALVRLHISAGNYAAADEVIRDIEDNLGASDNVKERSEMECDKTRIAIEQGDIAKAAEVFHGMGNGSSTFSVARTGYYAALDVRLKVASDIAPELLERSVNVLQHAHLLMRDFGAQDFEAYALYLGLIALGRANLGRTLLREYTDSHRRVPWPMPAPMAAALNAGDSHEVDTTTALFLTRSPRFALGKLEHRLSGSPV